MLLREAAKEYGWRVNMGGIALMWRGGCIIRSRFLGKIKEAYDKKPDLHESAVRQLLCGCAERVSGIVAEGIVKAIALGVPTPAFSTALAFYDGYRTARLPANLLQAQRDFFGAHTYERVDQPRGIFPHELDGAGWTGFFFDLQRLGPAIRAEEGPFLGGCPVGFAAMARLKPWPLQGAGAEARFPFVGERPD